MPMGVPATILAQPAPAPRRGGQQHQHPTALADNAAVREPDPAARTAKISTRRRSPSPVDPDGFALDRLDQVAAHYYGDPALGRMIAEFNDLDDLLRFQEGDRLRMPRRGALAQSA